MGRSVVYYDGRLAGLCGWNGMNGLDLFSFLGVDTFFVFCCEVSLILYMDILFPFFLQSSVSRCTSRNFWGLSYTL